MSETSEKPKKLQFARETFTTRMHEAPLRAALLLGLVGALIGYAFAPKGAQVQVYNGAPKTGIGSGDPWAPSAGPSIEPGDPSIASTMKVDNLDAANEVLARGHFRITSPTGPTITSGAGAPAAAAPAGSVYYRTDGTQYNNTDGTGAGWTQVFQSGTFPSTGCGGAGEGVITLTNSGSTVCGQFLSIAGTSLSSSGATVNLSFPTTACSAGSAITSHASSGAPTCSTFFNTAGTSLTNTGSTVNLNFPTTACSAGSAITSHASSGAPTCSAFFNAAGDHLSSSGSTVSLAQIATARILGRTTAGAGNVEDLTATQVTAMLNTFTTTLKGLVPAPGASPGTTFLRDDGTWATPPGGGGTVTSVTGGQSISTTGTTAVTVSLDFPTTACTAGQAVTSSSSAGVPSCSTFFNTAGTSLTNTGSTVNLNFPTTACSAGSAITSHASSGAPTCSAFFNAAGDHLSSSGSTVSLAQIATAKILGRTTAGTGNVEDLTGTQVTAMLNTFTSLLNGLVPASGGGTTTFLRADGNWATPAGTGVSSVVAGQSISVTGTTTPTVALNFPTTACSAGSAIVSHDSAGAPTCSAFFNVAGDHLSSSGSTVSLAQIATASFLGRTTAGTGNVETLTAAQATALLNTVTTSVKGLVPTLPNVATQYFDGTGAYSVPTGTSFGNHSTGLDGVCTFDGIASPVCGATLSGSTYTMTRDIFPSSGSLATAVTLKPANFRIMVQGVFTGSGTATILADGGDASGGTAGTTIAAGFYGAGTAGEAGVTNGSQAGNAAASGAIPNFPANATNSVSNAGATGNVGGSVGQVPSKGGGGGGSSGNTPGGGGTVTLVTAAAANGGVGLFEYSRGQNRAAATLFTGGSGGGGGAGTGASCTGGGGGGGSFIYFEAGECAGTITFTAKGGNGGNGTIATGTAGGGGGGGGGNIGVICGINSGTMTEIVTGGTHGNGAGGGGNGGDGAAGTKFLVAGR